MGGGKKTKVLMGAGCRLISLGYTIGRAQNAHAQVGVVVVQPVASGTPHLPALRPVLSSSPQPLQPDFS